MNEFTCTCTDGETLGADMLREMIERAALSND